MKIFYFIIFILIILLSSIVLSQEIVSVNDSTNNNNSTIINNVPEKDKSSNIIPIISIISVVITSIGVAYFSGYFSRKTEFEKNVIQKRIELFTEFTKDYEPCIRDIRTDVAKERIAHKDGIKSISNKKIFEITKLLWTITSKRNTIKLVLNASDREKFDNFCESIKSLTIASYTDKKTYLEEIDEKYNQIEKIFYKNLIKVKFNQKFHAISKAIKGQKK